MKSSRRTLSAAAIVALAAWANVQAMACCLLPGNAGTETETAAAVGEETTSSHGCCPSSAADADQAGESGQTSSGGCGMDAQGFTSPCCETGETAAVSAKSASSSDVPAGTVIRTENPAEAVSAKTSPPRFVSTSPPNGSPPFLSFQRLLI